MARELQTKFKKAEVVTDLTQDFNMEDQRLLLKEHQLEIEEPELQNKSKKVKVVTDLMQDFNMKDQRLLLKERQLAIEEREVKLEHERIELIKLKKNLNIE